MVESASLSFTLKYIAGWIVELQNREKQHNLLSR